jgi:hypothetical protein
MQVFMTYEEHHNVLVEYLKSKVEIADWHGVSDAANDLRVLEAQHAALKIPPHIVATGWAQP